MQWEDLTSLDFEKAVQTCDGVGIIPVGVIEAHGPHLPLGMDAFEAHWTACRAAEQEPAIVVPFYPFGINHESRHLPGALVLRRELVFALLEALCDEMGRNGLTKIVLLNGHGGNRYYLPLFVQTLVEQARPYVVYYADLPFSEPKDLLETEEIGHACEAETSHGLYLLGDRVKMDQTPPAPFTNLHRNAALQAVGAYSPVDWHAMYPAMFVGDPSKATAEKGRWMAEQRVAAAVALLRAVKADAVTPALYRDFVTRAQHPIAPDVWTKAGGEK